MTRVDRRVGTLTLVGEKIIPLSLPSKLLKQEIVVLNSNYYVRETPHRLLQANMKRMPTIEDSGLLDMAVLYLKEIFCLHVIKHIHHNASALLSVYIAHIISIMRVCMYVCDVCVCVWLMCDECMCMCACILVCACVCMRSTLTCSVMNQSVSRPYD